MYFLSSVKPFTLLGTGKKFWGLLTSKSKKLAPPNSPLVYYFSLLLICLVFTACSSKSSLFGPSGTKGRAVPAAPWSTLGCQHWFFTWLCRTSLDFSEMPWLIWALCPPRGKPCASHPLSSLAHGFLHGYFVPGSFPFTEHLPVEETFGGVVLNFRQLP